MNNHQPFSTQLTPASVCLSVCLSVLDLTQSRKRLHLEPTFMRLETKNIRACVLKGPSLGFVKNGINTASPLSI